MNLFFFNTYMSAKIAKANLTQKFFFFDLSMWLLVLSGESIQGTPCLSSYDYLTCPTYLHSDQHWILISIAHLKTAFSDGHCSIYILGPLCHDRQTLYNKVSDIVSAAVREQDKHILDKNKLTFYQGGESILPRQPLRNKTDCGLYVMVYVELLVREPDPFLRYITEKRKGMAKNLQGKELRQCLLMLLEDFANARLEGDCLIDGNGQPIIDEIYAVFLSGLSVIKELLAIDHG